MSAITGSGTTTIITTNTGTSGTTGTQTTQETTSTQSTTSSNVTPIYFDFGTPRTSPDLIGTRRPTSPEDAQMILAEVLEAVEKLSDEAQRKRIEAAGYAARGLIDFAAGLAGTITPLSISYTEDLARIEEAKVDLAAAQARVGVAQGEINTADYNLNYLRGYRDNLQGQLNWWSGEKTSRENTIANLNGQLNAAIAANKPANEIQAIRNDIDFHQGHLNNINTAIYNLNNEISRVNGEISGWENFRAGAVQRKAVAEADVTRIQGEINTLETRANATNNTINLLNAVMLIVYSMLALVLRAASGAVDPDAMATDNAFTKLKERIAEMPDDFRGTVLGIWNANASNPLGGGLEAGIVDQEGLKRPDQVKAAALGLISGILDILNVLAGIEGLFDSNRGGLEENNMRFKLAI